MPSISRKRLVNSANWGEPPRKAMGCAQTLKFAIHNIKPFIECNITPDGGIKSPPLFAHGCHWVIICCATGYPHPTPDISFHLECSKEVTVKYTMRCKGERVSNVAPFSSASYHPNTSVQCFLEKSKLEQYLEKDGSLVIEVDIQRVLPIQHPSIWYPKKLERQDILENLYQDASSETADVAFSFKNKLLHAHKNILSLRCKKLHEIAKEMDDNVPIVINSTKEAIFKNILDFAYTVKEPEIENKDYATELLVTADFYDCVHLKLYVESFIVDKFLTHANAAELFLFADSYSCALLKEAATNLFVTDAPAVKKGEAWPKIKESNRFLSELLEAFTCPDEAEKDDCPNKFEYMDIAGLREELEYANLELDGSREILLERLKTYREQQDKEKVQEAKE